MIDLTKPIRRKSTKQAVFADPCVIVRHDNDYRTYTPTCFEELYENIPEPRKPREFWIVPNPGQNFVREVGQKIEPSIRVIEWPEYAPLPDWPESKI